MGFYILGILGFLWFFFVCMIMLPLALLRPFSPSVAQITARLFTKYATRVIGMKVIIHNKERLLSSQPCIYVGNHQNMLDVLVHACVYPPNTIAIGKRELFWIPFFGQLLFLTGNILIHRKHHMSAMESMSEAQRAVKEKKFSVYMFPEGTRNKDSTKLLPFKRGAFHLAITTQVPIVPVVASATHHLVNFSKKQIRPGTVNVAVLEPISTQGLNSDDVDALIEKSRSAMQKSFDELKTEVKQI